MSASSTAPDSAHTVLVAQLQSLWQQKLASNDDVQKSRSSLGFHRRKVQQLEEELGSARDWEEELQARVARLEEGLRPALLRMWDKLERGEVVERELVEDCLASGGAGDLKILLVQRLMRMELLERRDLLRLVQTLLRVRSVLVEREEEGVVQQFKGLARRVVRQLGSGGISWGGMVAWEVGVVQELVGEVAGVPSFLARLLEHLMGEVEERAGQGNVARGVQVNMEEEQ